MSRIEVTCIHAEGDGVAPCFIVSLCSDKSYVRPCQYLFHVPEGFSRLALEHRARPGLGLRSIFITNGVSPKTIGGLGGLILRLKSDGHGEVTLIGPKGIHRVVDGLREGIEVIWSNPQVHIKELTSGGSHEEDEGAYDYEDGDVQVAAIYLERHWSPPPFFLSQDPDPDLQPNPSSEGGKKSDPSRLESCSSSSDSSSDADDQPSKPQPKSKPTLTGSDGMFSCLDELLSNRSKGVNTSQLKHGSGKKRGKGQGLRLRSSGGSSGSLLKTKVLELLKSGDSKPHSASTKRPRGHQGEGDGEGEGHEDQKEDASASSLVGYLMHFKSSGKVLFIVSCSHHMLIDPLSRHPLFERNEHGLHKIHEQHRLLCTLHLSPLHVSKATRYQEWMKRLPGHQAFSSFTTPSRSTSIPLEPSNSSKGQAGSSSASLSMLRAINLGFVASARVSVKLNRVSSVLFPLPQSLLDQYLSLNSQQMDPEDQGKKAHTIPPKLLGLGLMAQLKMSLAAGGASLEIQYPTSEPQQESESADLSSLLAQLHQQVPELHQSSPLISPLSLKYSQSPIAHPPLPSQGWLISIATYMLDLQQGMIPRTAARPALVDNRRMADEMRKKLKGSHATPRVQPLPSQQEIRNDPKVLVPAQSTLCLSLSTLHTMAKIDEDPIPPCLASAEAAQTRLSFLGTGSAEPSKHRGPSAILIQLPGGGLLMDVGEGTWGQLIRAYGEGEAVKVVASLHVIWISHKHADHTLGLIQILNARLLGAKIDPLVIVGPAAVGKWLGIHFASDDAHKPRPSASWSFVHCSKFNSSLVNQDSNVMSSTSRLGLSQWKSVPVHHCKDSYALVISSSVGWKIVYSGDCRPSAVLQEEGKDATLLIHESTFDPSRREMALQKRHSTSDEAIEVARGMRAYRIILSHFSQRYPRMPEGLSDESCSSDPLKSLREIPMVAFDGLVVPLSLLPVLPLVLPSMKMALNYEATTDL